MRLEGVLVAMIMLSSCAAVLSACEGAEGAISDMGYSVNGNQELISDPTRPIVYSADPYGDTVHVLDATTMSEVWNITVGTSPMSLDVSEDGMYLYVAVSTERQVVVVDLELQTISDTIDLTFQPLSVRKGLSGRLYLTDIPGLYESGGPKVVDETTGALLENQSGYGTCVLEMSPDKTTMLMLQLGSSPTKIYKYACDGDTLVLLDEDNHDLASNARQIAVDWTNGTIYLAAGGGYGVEVISLETMNMTGFMEASAYPRGVALSPDGTLVFCTIWTGEWDIIWVFNVTAGTTVNKYFLDVGPDLDSHAAITAPVGAGCVVAVGRPLLFLDLGEPTIFPGFPRPGENVGYDFLSVDGCELTAYFFGGIPAQDITSHSLEIDGAATDTSIWELALRGVLLEPVTDGGEHGIDATIVWDGGSVHINWTFYSSETEHVVSASPEQGSEMDQIPEDITVVLDLGYPVRGYVTSQVELNGPSPLYEIEGNVVTVEPYADGMCYVLPGRNTLYMEITFIHTDYVEQVYSHLYFVLQFTVVNTSAAPSLEGLEWHNVTGVASVMLPEDWHIEDNLTEEGVSFDFMAVEPLNGTIQSVITLQSGFDPLVADDEAFLDSVADSLVDEMQNQSILVYIVDAPEERVISGRNAVVFSIRWVNEPIVQKFAVIIDQANSSYWMLIMTVDVHRYFSEDPMLEGVISTFEDYEPYVPPDDEDETTEEPVQPLLVILGGVGAAVAAAAVTTVWILTRKGPSPPAQ